MAKAVGWRDIPDGLKERKQWCVSNYTHPEPLERKAPRIARGSAPHASIHTPSNWVSFEEAAQYAWEHGTDHWCIGFIITKDDPFCCIDLDVKDFNNAPDKPHTWTTDKQLDDYWRVSRDADTYVETSIGGRSLHVWVEATIGEGVKQNGIEIYSQERYIITTGNAVINKPIRAAQQMMDLTVANLRSLVKDTKTVLVELEEEDSDEEIMEKAMNASNAAKFNELCAGRWQQYGYPSQSEADMALMSMFTFYSKSNAQCRRLFRMTILGAREKAQKNDKFLDYTLAIIRGRMERDNTVEISAIMKAGELIARKFSELPPTSERTVPLAHSAAIPLPQHLPPPAVPAYVPPAGTVETPAAHVNGKPYKGSRNEIEWPPGLVGWTAQFIYHNAPRPVKEVAIVAAIGFMAGVCGKAFMLPQSGLNIYMVLVGRSAIGKEAMHSGIAAILEALRDRSPAAMKFVDFSEFASGPALTKSCITNPSFVNVSGEWGRKLKRMADDNGRDAAMQSLRTAMTNLYQKSGPTSIVGGISYSKKEDNVLSVSGVAYSMIGETTPTTYYESLTESMMEDGFLSRFTMLEYTGERPPFNKQQQREPNKELSDYLSQLCAYALPRASGHTRPVHVLKDAEATEIIDAFDAECDMEINRHTEESKRQMWNRASLKAQRIAGLLAVGDNFTFPTINKAQIEWAIDLIRRDIALMQKKFEDGDVGQGDDSRERKILSILDEYMLESPGEGYQVPEKLRKDAIVPRKYLQIRCTRLNPFTKHRLGATSSMDATLRSLTDSGYLMEVAKDKLVTDYSFHGKCFRILDLPGKR